MESPEWQPLSALVVWTQGRIQDKRLHSAYTALTSVLKINPRSTCVGLPA